MERGGYTTFLEFFAKWNGRFVDTDHQYGAQCLDLMHQYCVEVLGLPLAYLAAPSAKDVYLNFGRVAGSQYFQRVPNMPWNFPKQGDIVLWGQPMGKYTDNNGKVQYDGHVGIANEGNARRFTSFDQNFSPDKSCRLVEHTYTGVLGWLTFKGK